MPAAFRLAALIAALTTLAPATSRAMDDYIAASSSGPMALELCGDDNEAPIKTVACQQAGYDKLVAGIEMAFAAALARAPALTKPLLKRDQAWFNETVLSAADSLPQSDDAGERAGFGDILRKRAATLQDIKSGFGRPGYAGRWANAFGTVAITPADSGGYRVAVDTRAVYGSGDDHVRQCQATALVKPESGGWLAGMILRDEDQAAKPVGDGKAPAAGAKPAAAKSPSLKLRRQGETLRMVVSGEDWRQNGRDECEYMWQLTASYFAGGPPDAAATDKQPTDKADTSLVAPTFDCTRPETASEEEICADPDLADNDQRLNRAWKALLPRLDDVTRRALMDDQRNWVHAQATQYPEFLHPAWEKLTSFMHFTADARDRLYRLQRERIALLDGFDDNRNGLAGVWLGYNAILTVTVDNDGSVSAEGWKWDQGDWKAGCDYAIRGEMAGGTFRSDDNGKNPDTLERDRSTLIVNRRDDAAAKKRGPSNQDEDGKCKRSRSASSTARLFPARTSPDINDFGSSIR